MQDRDTPEEVIESRRSEWERLALETKKSDEAFFQSVIAQRRFISSIAEELKKLGIDLAPLILREHEAMKKFIADMASRTAEIPPKD